MNTPCYEVDNDVLMKDCRPTECEPSPVQTKTSTVSHDIRKFPKCKDLFEKTCIGYLGTNMYKDQTNVLPLLRKENESIFSDSPEYLIIYLMKIKY